MSHTRVLDTAAEIADLKRRVADLEAQIRLLVPVRPVPQEWPRVQLDEVTCRPLVPPGETAWLVDRPPSQIVGHWLPEVTAAQPFPKPARKGHTGPCWRNSHGDCGC